MSAFGTPMEACDCTTFHWPCSRISTPVIRTGRSPPARTREAPAPLSPGDIALDVNVDVIGYRPDAVAAAGGGHGIHDLRARPPLLGVGPDMDGIGTLRET